MKVLRLFQHTALVLVFALTAAAQETQPQKRDDVAKTGTEVKADNTPTPVAASNDKSGQADKSAEIKVKTDDTQTVTPETTAEAKEILPYYKNYLDKYLLGPTDVISIEVFGQCPSYCKTNVTIPPTGKISYPLIKGGVFVAGRTVEQVEEDVKSKLDEYIIDPNVTVTLDKAMSVRYSVLGKVASPGVRVMERRMTIYEAIVEAGGIAKEGNRKKVVLYRYDPKGNLTSQLVNLEAIERGKAPMIELQAGDQVFVADKGFQMNMNSVFDILSKASIVRFLFGSPF